MAEYIQAKTILSKVRTSPDDPYGITYNMNLYRGCQHGCIYCDSRSSCYRIKDFSEIKIKENALTLLDKELSGKKIKGTIGTGSMNDPYMPLEEKLMLVRNALEIIYAYRYPVHIITKSDLVLRDADIIKQIGKVYSAVTVTITTDDDVMSGMIEPSAPVSSKRFKALELLAKEGIYTGISLTPVLPYITGSRKNIGNIIEKAKNAGAKYIVSFMGMTLREGQREYYYEKLYRYFPGMKEIYIKQYKNSYSCDIPDAGALKEYFLETCGKYSIETKMRFFHKKEEQLKLF